MLKGTIPDMKGFLPSSAAHVPNADSDTSQLAPSTNLPMFAMDCEMVPCPSCVRACSRGTTY